MGTVLCDCCKNNIIKSHTNVCPECKTINSTDHCKSCQNFPPTYIVGDRSELIGTLIHDLKYHSVRALARPLAEILNQILPNNSSAKIILVPLPTSHQHIRARGLDHTYLIAKQLAKLNPNYQIERVLLRAKDTTQVGTDRQTRLTQAKSAYIINSNITIHSQASYLLLDDVWTTGASMKAAIKKLSSAGAKQIKIALLALSRDN